MNYPSSEIFVRNVTAVAAYDAGAADILCSLLPVPPEGFAIITEPARNGMTTCHITTPGGTRVSVHSTFNPAAESDKIARLALRAGVVGYVISGFGLGYLFESLCAVTDVSLPVVIVDSFHAIVAAAFSQRDFSALISSRKPRFVFAESCERHESEIASLLEQGYAVADSPYVKTLKQLIEIPVPPAPESRVWKASGPLGLPSLEGLRVAVFTGGGTTIPIIAGDCAEALTALGAKVVTLRVAIDSSLPDGMPPDVKDSLVRFVADFRPHFFLSADGGVFRSAPAFFAALAVPVAVWFFDDPTLAMKPHHVLPNVHIFVWDRWYAETLRRTGFEEVHYLPLGTSPRRFSRERAALCRGRFVSPVSFVGDSMVAQSIARTLEQIGDPDDARFVAAMTDEIVAAPTEGAREIFARTEARTGLCRGHFDVEKLWLGLSIEASVRLRHEIVNRAAGVAQVTVYGDDGWPAVMAAGVKYGGRIDYENEICGVYADSVINLNITKLQLRQAVNQRVFDAPLCGGFVATDYRSDLDELFDPEKEICCFRSTDEVSGVIGRYLADSESREAVIVAAEKRVLAHHTWHHRVSELAHVLARRCGFALL